MSDITNACVRRNYGALPCNVLTNNEHQKEEVNSVVGYCGGEEEYLHARQQAYLSDDNNDCDDADYWDDQLVCSNGGTAEHCVIVTVFPDVADECDDVLLEAETDVDRPEEFGNKKRTVQSLEGITSQKFETLSSCSQHASQVTRTSSAMHYLMCVVTHISVCMDM